MKIEDKLTESILNGYKDLYTIRKFLPKWFSCRRRRKNLKAT